MVNTYNLGLLQHTTKLMSIEADNSFSDILSLRIGVNCVVKKTAYSHNIPLLLYITDKFCDNYTLGYNDCNTEFLPTASFTVDVACGIPHTIDISKVITQVIPSVKNYDIVISKQGTNGTSAVSNKTIIYTANTGYVGKDEIMFYLSHNGKQITSPATIYIDSCCDEIKNNITICNI